MTCNESKKLLIDYQEGRLDTDTDNLVLEHLNTCPACREEAAALGLLLKKIEQAVPVLPEKDLTAGFHQMLADEKAKLPQEEFLAIPRKTTTQLKRFLGVAATVALLFISFGLGKYTQQQLVAQELASLRKEYNQLNKLMALSLMEDQSASKRLQAVNYAQGISEQDEEILVALTQMMQNDRSVNARLAAVNALAKFADNQVVIGALIDTLKRERNANIQLDIIQILVSTEAKLAIPLLRELLQKQEIPPYVKEQIRIGLAQMS